MVTLLLISANTVTLYSDDYNYYFNYWGLIHFLMLGAVENSFCTVSIFQRKDSV